MRGDQLRLQQLVGISVAPQVGSPFRQAVPAARRTTQSDAPHHRPYKVTGKSVHAARCTAEPLLVIARLRVLLCIFHSCMAIERLFVAVLEAQVGNYNPHFAREVQKILDWNRCRVQLGGHNALVGEEGHNLFWAWEQIVPLLAYVEKDPTWQVVVGLRTLLLGTRQFWLCHALCVDLLMLCSLNTAAGSRGKTICCSSKRILVQCL